MVRLRDDFPANSIEFTDSAFAVVNGERSATVTVRRIGDVSGPASVQYATGDGTAHAGREYEARKGVLRFGPLETLQSFTIPVASDSPIQGVETVVLSLSNAVGVAVIGLPTAQLRIADDELSPFFRIQAMPWRTVVPILKLLGHPGKACWLEAASDVSPSAEWEQVATFEEFPGWERLVFDSAAGTFTSRFYRVASW